jgi:hypothetical protein
MPALGGAYSSTRYSRVVLTALRPPEDLALHLPCVECTTMSPAFSCSGSTTFRRRDASFLTTRPSAPIVRP